MSQSPIRRPTSNVEDFKARFGVAGAQRPSPELPKQNDSRSRGKPQRESRYPLGAIALSLLFGAVGAGAFFVAYDYKVFGALFARSVSAPETTPTNVATAPPPPDSSVAKSSTGESPVFAEVPVPPKPAPAEQAEASTVPAPQAAPPVAAAETPEVPAVAPVAQAAPVVAAPAAPAEPPAEIAEDTTTQVETVTTDSSASATEGTDEPVASAAVPESAVPAAAPSDTQVAMAPVPAPVPAVAAPEPAVAAPAPVVAAPAAVPAKPLLMSPTSEQLLVSGQVFRDCENCPDILVVVPPKRSLGANDVQVMQRAEATDLKPFALGRFEVTFDDWAFCVTSGGCTQVPNDEGWGRNTRPVINVSHKMIEEQYLPWISQLTGKAYRLPTSAEWQYAESGAEFAGQVALDPQMLCQTSNFSSTNAAEAAGAVSCNDGYPTSSPAGVHRPNAIGLHDMRGNVWEWVSDCWTPGFTYKAKPSELECRKRVVRGGSWSSRAELKPEAAKGFEDATRVSKTIGFRIARDLP